MESYLQIFLRLILKTEITYFHLPEAFSITVHFLPLLLYTLPNNQIKRFNFLKSNDVINALLPIHGAMNPRLAQRHKLLLKETRWRKMYSEILFKSPV